MSATVVDDRYTIITADTHAGGSHAQYREYLDPKYLDDFDAWRGKYRNPFKDLKDDRRKRNWDNERRYAEQEADGVVGEVIFPNTVPPFFPSFVLFAQPPEAGGLRAPPRRHPGPQPLARRLRRRGARAPRRHRPDLPQRRRRRHRGRHVDQGARPARRRAAAQRPARREVGQARCTTPSTTRCGRVLEDLEMPVNVARRHRRARLRQVPVLDAAVHQRGRLLLAAPVRAHAARRRVRALPEAEVRDDRDRLRVGAAAARAPRRHDHQDPRHRRHRRDPLHEGEHAAR